jgi:arsenate reductase-like glutaredoxin family protein
MKNQPPPRGEAIRLMSENPNLIRRPILIDGRRILFGWDAGEYGRLAKT